MIKVRKPEKDEELYLAEIRARAMHESLTQVGRYDEHRVRARFLDSYNPLETKVIMSGSSTIGFYVVTETKQDFKLKHLYVEDGYRSTGVGKAILDKVKHLASSTQKAITLNALVGSRANQFYLRNNFQFKYSDEIDNFYEWRSEFEEVPIGGHKVRFSNESIDPEVYNSLRLSIGWTSYSLDQIETGLENSLFSLLVTEGGKPIGMGRIIGDGIMVFYIQDIIVLPEYQKCGVGHEIMTRLMNYINSKAVNNSIIGLMAAVGKERFYEKFGFNQRPNERMGCGMTIWVKKTNCEQTSVST